MSEGGEIELTYGTIQPQDIPLIMREPMYSSYWRLSGWMTVIITALLILAIYVVREAHEQKELRNTTSKLLMNERNALIRRCDLVAGTADVPYAKSIEINISKSNLPNISQGQLDCLFSYWITTADGKMAQLKGSWQDNGASYLLLLILPNQTRLSSLVLHTLIDQIFANGWQTTFKSFNVLVRDKANTIIWRDTVILDFITGDSTAGYIGGGYIPLQFDLNKY